MITINQGGAYSGPTPARNVTLYATSTGGACLVHTTVQVMGVQRSIFVTPAGDRVTVTVVESIMEQVKSECECDLLQHVWLTVASGSLLTLPGETVVVV
jgi:hypothetical protein